MTKNNSLKLQFIAEMPGEYRSKKFWEWVKSIYPNLDIHYILRKDVDYLLHPVVAPNNRMSSRYFHSEIVNKKKGYYFELWLNSSVALLVRYLTKHLKYSQSKVNKLGLIISPKDVKKLIELVQREEKNG